MLSTHYIIKKLSAFFVFMSISCIAVNVITLLGSVFSRYLFGSSPIWTDEFSRYLLIGGVMLISGVVLEKGQHMRLNLIDKLPSKKIRYSIYIYQNIVTTAVFIFMTYCSFNYAISIYKFTTIGLGISKTIPMFSLPIGFCSLSIFSIVELFKLLFKFDKQELA